MQSDETFMIQQQDTTTGLKERIIIREIDMETAAAELRARAAQINTVLSILDEAQIVTQETLQIEFSI